MRQQYIRFADLPARAEFVYHGDTFRKQSTRTARYCAYPNRWFYFRPRVLCIVGHYCMVFWK